MAIHVLSLGTVEGYDQGLLFDRSATLSSPAFPEIAVLLAPLFAPL